MFFGLFLLMTVFVPFPSGEVSARGGRRRLPRRAALQGRPGQPGVCPPAAAGVGGLVPQEPRLVRPRGRDQPALSDHPRRAFYQHVLVCMFSQNGFSQAF
eukprot:scaffold277477_cov21-Prasinocladus_malaysianus.AAC.1